jgi:hypothetical protein
MNTRDGTEVQATIKPPTTKTILKRRSLEKLTVQTPTPTEIETMINEIFTLERAKNNSTKKSPKKL